MLNLTYQESKEAGISIQVHSLFFLFKQASKFAARVIKHSWAELYIRSKSQGIYSEMEKSKYFSMLNTGQTGRFILLLSIINMTFQLQKWIIISIL